jgi:putative nucleotidyltransferase with HDIG domain
MFASRQEFKSLASALVAAQRSIALYPPGHPRIKASLDDCFRLLRDLLQRHQQVPIVLADKEFVVGDLQIPIGDEISEELAATLREAGVEKLIFSEGLRSWELQVFLRLLDADSDARDLAGDFQRLLDSEGTQHILAGTLVAGPVEEPADDMLVQAWEAYTAGLRVVRKLRHGYRTSGTLDNLDETKGFVRDLVELAAQHTRPLLALQSLKVHDEYSFTHSINVATLTLAMAQGLSLPRYDLHEITLAAILHDIGKERVSGEVLRKPGKLNDAEWKEMADHSLLGAKILATADGVGDLAPIVAYEHHLKQARRGSGSSRWRLHVVSEMVTIADVYDALRSTRPYRGEIPPDRALEIMQAEAEEKFNPDLFAGFSRLVGYYPPGICVRLSNGATAIVYRTDSDALDRPGVLFVRDEDGEHLESPYRLELVDADEGELSVSAVLDAESAGVDPFDYL